MLADSVKTPQQAKEDSEGSRKMQRTRAYGSTLMLQSENFSTEKRTLRKNTQELAGYIEGDAQLSSGAQQLANLKTSTEFASYNDLQ